MEWSISKLTDLFYLLVTDFDEKDFYLNRNMGIAVLTMSSSSLLYFGVAIGDLLRIYEYVNCQEDGPEEDDLLAADLRKLKELRSPPKEK
eukprot:IDg5999t1